MRIIHNSAALHERTVEKEGEAGFLLTNKKGDYLLFGPHHKYSNYQGLLFFNQKTWSYFKTIDAIRIERNLTCIENKYFEVFRKYDTVTEKFFLAENGLCYEIVNYSGPCSLDLDFRDIVDYDDKGRVYTIFTDGKFVVIEHKKYADHDLTKLQHTHYLVLLGLEKYEKIGEWKKRTYLFDKQRGAKAEFYIYTGLKIMIENDTKIAMSHSQDLATAKAHAEDLLQNIEFQKSEKSELSLQGIKEKGHAEIAALNSLKGLTLAQKDRTFGILAGLPWFFQFWARDELISSVYLLLTKKYALMKELLFNYLKKIRDDGRIPNRLPDSELASADAIGWLFKRTHDLIIHLEREKRLKTVLPKQELEYIFEQLVFSTGRLNRQYAKDYLIHNGQKETWMDTAWHEDTREGCRIEIQALQLCMYNLTVKLGKMLGHETWKNYAELENKLREQVRSIFYDGKILADGFVNGVVDKTIRPNVFIAYYVYPELFTSYEWKRIFDVALEKIWLDWGGLASIDKTHPLFCPHYTGENNQSYHRGDSWYYINNMAGACMHDLDPGYYWKYIEKIIEASSQEILYSGLAGHHAEISSAAKLESQGCLCQAWSSALFLELMSKIHA
ncbi:MAG: amylo-alpha-1,6-glucosidase [Nanoarchaeota archaeon]